MIGNVFGRLTVKSLSHRDKRHRKHFACVCECGTEKTVQAGLLRSGNTRSCGCLAKDSQRAKLLPRNKAVISHIILQYKRHAKGRNIEFLLSYDEVEKLVRGNCAYCGVLGGNIKKTKNCRNGFRHNGIDRVDNSMPYTLGNVVSCCGMCNIGKRDKSAKDFIDWARRIAAHQDAMAAQWGGDARDDAALRGMEDGPLGYVAPQLETVA